MARAIVKVTSSDNIYIKACSDSGILPSKRTWLFGYNHVLTCRIPTIHHIWNHLYEHAAVLIRAACPPLAIHLS